jgi:L-aspartate oxidase
VTDALESDVLIIGAGLAGLSLALRLAPRPCIVLSPAPLGQAAASAWAQGGVAAPLGAGDTPELHAADTIAAGAGLVDPMVAALLSREAAARVEDLLALGVPFDRLPDGSLALSREAAHSRPRVVRVAGDLAGRAIMRALTTAVRRAPHITVLEGVRAVALLEDDVGIAGALVRGPRGNGAIRAGETVLATGGIGGLFRVTTNPREARGAAIAQAFRAGAVLADLEFVQFHPTAIDIGADPAPLATEALRGEGARLVDSQGEPFMLRYDAAAELAPRDVVARAVHAERRAGRGAWLDGRSSVGAAFPERFPTVFSACMSVGIDPRTQPIPIAPAAHYHMGGVVTDPWGATTLPGLSACGECASTGANGANRLASNSLLESMVFGARIAQRLRDASSPALRRGHAQAPPQLDVATLDSLRERMSRDCGVIRDGEGLAGLLDWISVAERQAGGPSALTAARLIATAALQRRESRGGHWRSDHPVTEEVGRRTFMARAGDTDVAFLDQDPFPSQTAPRSLVP